MSSPYFRTGFCTIFLHYLKQIVFRRNRSIVVGNFTFIRRKGNGMGSPAADRELENPSKNAAVTLMKSLEHDSVFVG